MSAEQFAAIATNFQVKGGGDHYLILRTFGLDFGAAIGIALVDDNGVRESSEYQSLDPAPSGCAGHGHQRNDFFFEQI